MGVGCEFMLILMIGGMYGVMDHMSVWCHGSHDLYGVVDYVSVWCHGSCDCMVSWIM